MAVLLVQRVEDVALEAPQASHFSREIMKCDRTRLFTFLSLSSQGSSRRVLGGAFRGAFPVRGLRRRRRTIQQTHPEDALQQAKAITAVALTSASINITWLAAVFISITIDLKYPFGYLQTFSLISAWKSSQNSTFLFLFL